MLKMINSSILGRFLLFVTLLMHSTLYAQDDVNLLSLTHTARIISPRAIIYSDENLASPIGYISNAKLITVGNPKHSNPDIVPMVVYGRLAFIEVKNLHYESDSSSQLNTIPSAPREHNIDIILENPEEKLSLHNTIYFDLHSFSAGSDIQNLFSAIDGSNKKNLFGYGLSMVHRQTPGRVLWGLGFEYNSISTDAMSFNYFMINPIIGFTPIRNPLFLIDLTFSLDLSVGATLKIKSNSDDEPSAFIYGSNIGARIVFLPNQYYHFTGSIGYKSYKVKNIENVYDSQENLISGISNLEGVNLAAGISLEF